MNNKLTISNILKNLGVPAHLSGYRYLRTAIESVQENLELLDYITELYCVVADKHGKTYSKVERAIRHAIELAWNQGDLDFQLELFGNSVSPHTGKPTNGCFIATIADYIMITQEE